MLEINTEDKGLNGEPDGYLNVMWHKVDALEMPTTQQHVRTVIGWIGLIGVAVLFGGGNPESPPQLLLCWPGSPPSRGRADRGLWREPRLAAR